MARVSSGSRSIFVPYGTAHQRHIEAALGGDRACSDGGWWMRICTEKTETEATLPISDEALELCGEVQN